MIPAKQLLLDEIKEKIDQSKSLVITRYQKFEPNLAANFRMRILQSGGSFEVVKKRVLMKAAETCGFTLDRGQLGGHIGVVFADQDPFQTTKALYQFRKENEDIFEVLGGRFEGKLYTAKDVEMIASLPGKDEMRAQFLSLLEAPMSEMLGVVEALLTSVIHCVENKSNQSNT